MPFLEVLASGKSFPLLSDAVNEPRATHLAHGGQRVDQLVDVVTIYRAEIAESELLEQDTGRKEGLHALLPFPHQRCNSGKRSRGGVDYGADCRANAVVKRIALNRGEILRHRADVRRNRHLVVVQNDDEVPIRRSRVVQSLVGETTRRRSVAEDGDDLEILTVEVAGDGHS